MSPTKKDSAMPPNGTPCFPILLNGLGAYPLRDMVYAARELVPT